eukprot:GILI01011515.1.p1 GENE.GILI01011515.1~~GILI01011515.1.p1  ORF type:complete len:1048 (-),score=370.45 GILI01011515.1:173-2893(-)
MRDSQVKQISIFDLLVGDVVVIETGDKIPADGVLITAFNLSIDESSMTGESKLVRKRLPGHSDKGDPFVISGTKVEEGNGSMLVLAVGDKSIQGKTMRLLEEAADETPLQGKLEVIATDIGKLGGFAAILTVIAMLIRLAIVEITCTSEGCIEAGGPGWRHEILVEIVNFFLVGITVVVVAVPEGLPLAVTISLAYSVQKMFNEKNLVRHLDACETMGEANTICSDKTGTLTQNKMSVVKVWVGEKTFEHAPGVHEVNKDVAHLIGQGVSVNSTASLVTNSDGRLEQVGNKTECALLEYARHLNIDYDLVRASNLPKIVNRFTFSSKRKRMSTLLALQGSTLRVYCKGASEIVLDRCSSILTANGSVREMTKADRFFITKNVIENFASQGLRTLCLAYRDVNKNERDWENEMVDEDTPRAETDLTCIAVVGIEDPVRPEVPDAVLRCNTAGIVVRMVTGDNVETAKAIAQKCHIFDPTSASYNPRFTVMEGPDFRKFVGGFVYDEDGNARIADIENFKMVAQSLRVLARSSPSDKHLLVTGLKEINHVVAVTGDGTNDAPALKKADIGIAVDGATDAARAAADIVLTTPGLSVIIDAIRQSRKIFQRMKNYCIYRIACTLQLLCFFFFAILCVNPNHFLDDHSKVQDRFFRLPVIAIVLITVLNDGTILTIAYDKVIGSKKPEKWNLPELCVVSSILGAVACASSMLLLLLGLQAMAGDALLNKWFGLEPLTYGSVMTMMYLKVSLSDFFTVFSARTTSWFWVRKPGKALLAAFVFATAAATFTSLFWFLDDMQSASEVPMKSLSLKLAAVVWLYNLVWFVIQDAIKVLAYQYFAKRNQIEEAEVKLHQDIVKESFFASFSGSFAGSAIHNQSLLTRNSFVSAQHHSESSSFVEGAGTGAKLQHAA